MRNYYSYVIGLALFVAMGCGKEGSQDVAAPGVDAASSERQAGPEAGLINAQNSSYADLESDWTWVKRGQATQSTLVNDAGKRAFSRTDAEFDSYNEFSQP